MDAYLRLAENLKLEPAARNDFILTPLIETVSALSEIEDKAHAQIDLPILARARLLKDACSKHIKFHIGDSQFKVGQSPNILFEWPERSGLSPQIHIPEGTRLPSSLREFFDGREGSIWVNFPDLSPRYWILFSPDDKLPVTGSQRILVSGHVIPSHAVSIEIQQGQSLKSLISSLKGPPKSSYPWLKGCARAFRRTATK